MQPERSIRARLIDTQTSSRPHRGREHIRKSRVCAIEPLQLRREIPQARREPGLDARQIRRPGRHLPRLAFRREGLNTRHVHAQRAGRACGPAVGVADTGVVGVGRVVQTAVGGVALDEGGVGHAGVVQHEVGPHEAHQVDGALGLVGHEMHLQLEGGDEGGDGGAGFGGGSTVFAPSRGETVGDGSDLGGIGGETGEDGPAVAVLGVEGGGFVVTVEAYRAIPETGVGSSLDACSVGGPVCV